MNGWKESMVALLALAVLAPVILMAPPSSGAEVADHPILLYMYRNPFRLETTTPIAGIDTTPGSITPGQTVSYNLTYPLTDDLLVSAPLEEGVRYFIVHLQDSYVLPVVSGLALNVQIRAGKPGLTPVQIAATEFDQTEMVNDDLKVPMITNEGYEIEKGFFIELRLTLSGTGLVPSFFYTHIGASGNSHIAFLANPIPEEGVSLSMRGPGGFEVDGIVPNGPEEVRTVFFVCSVRDAFGAYDVANITLEVRSAEGNVLYSNFTDGPLPSGGQGMTYYNDTHTFPEGTPIGTYDVIVTGNSNTGQSASYTGKLEVRSGLFVSLESQLLEAESGDTATFRMRVLNGGSGMDRIAFTATSDRGWTVTVPETLELDGGDETIVEFRVVIPIRAALRSESNITMGASSRNADRTYTEVGRVVVIGVSTFGAEVISSASVDTFAGQQMDFDIKVVNLLDELRSFELSPEGLPSSWSVSYSGSNGSSQGSLYLFTIGPMLEAVVRVSVVPPPQSSGRTEFTVYVRAQGETDRKHLYLSVNVVDPERGIIELAGEATRTAVRKGTTFPVDFNKVFFMVQLYNPTLDLLDLDVDLSAREGWTAELDYDMVELAPGAGSTLNASITPPKGTLHNDGAPYSFTLTADGGNAGQRTLGLNIIIPAVHKIEVVPEREVIDVMEGSSTFLNVTVRNRGNTDGKVELAITSDEGVTAAIQPTEADIDPGQELVFQVEVSVGSIDELKVFTVTIEYTFQGKEESVQVSVSAQPGKEGPGIPWTYIIIGAAAVLALIGAVIMVLLLARRRSRKKGLKEPPSPAPPVVVQAVKEEPAQMRPEVSEAPEEVQTFEPVEAVEPLIEPVTSPTTPEDEEKAADDVMNQILGMEPPEEGAEVVEAELLE